jgi:hypothetical protein
MKKPVIDRRGIAKLMRAGWPKRELAERFQISRPFLDRILGQNAEPPHVGITLYINAQVQQALTDG